MVSQRPHLRNCRPSSNTPTKSIPTCRTPADMSATETTAIRSTPIIRSAAATSHGAKNRPGTSMMLRHPANDTRRSRRAVRRSDEAGHLNSVQGDVGRTQQQAHLRWRATTSKSGASASSESARRTAKRLRRRRSHSRPDSESGTLDDAAAARPHSSRSAFRSTDDRRVPRGADQPRTTTIARTHTVDNHFADRNL